MTNAVLPPTDARPADTRSTETAPPFLVIGEALIDIVRPAHAPEQRRVAGSPANVAVGLARLGYHARLATALGRDANAERIVEHLRASGVTIEPGSHRLERTATALATLDAGGAAEYVFDIAWEFTPPDAPMTRGHVHVGSIAAYLEPGGSAVARFAESLPDSVTVSFDPNVRPDLPIAHETVLQRAEELVASADIVKASDEDVAHLYPAVPVERVVAAWARGRSPVTGEPLAAGPGRQPARPRLVIATRGPRGATVAAADRVSHFPAAGVDVRDTVGAGDSFMAGLLSGLAEEGAPGASHTRDGAPTSADLTSAALTSPETVAAAVRRALLCSALTVQRVGADLPWRRDLVS